MASALAVNPAPASVKTTFAVGENAGEQPQDPAAGTDRENDEARWRPVLGLPAQLTVDLPLPDFTIADLLQLAPGSVARTGWRVTRDVPLRVNGIVIGWSEFEAVGNRLAVRLTELA
jgi:flagellar motor switch/type III secretory pathway protein FliN